MFASFSHHLVVYLSTTIRSSTFCVTSLKMAGVTASYPALLYLPLLIPATKKHVPLVVSSLSYVIALDGLVPPLDENEDKED